MFGIFYFVCQLFKHICGCVNRVTFVSTSVHPNFTELITSPKKVGTKLMFAFNTNRWKLDRHIEIAYASADFSPVPVKSSKPELRIYCNRNKFPIQASLWDEKQFNNLTFPSTGIVPFNIE